MFISYSETYGYEDPKTGMQYYDCTVEDTDFTETVFNTQMESEEVIYRVYSTKNVDIASEFLKFMLFDRTTGNYSITQLLDFYSATIFIQDPEFAIQVKEKIKKLQMVW